MTMEREPKEPVVCPEPAAEYEPPAVAWEEPFDPVAASCDPLQIPPNPECVP
jgi:hypothetical protein